jgi:hypothetical protein
MTTQGRPFVHVEIPAIDRMASAKFYADIFGWGFQHMDEMNYSMFESGNVGGGLPPVDDKLNQPGDVLVYVDSADIDSDLKKIELLGGKTIVPKTEIPGMGWFAVFTDPTGNRLALYTSPATTDS